MVRQERRRAYETAQSMQGLGRIQGGRPQSKVAPQEKVPWAYHNPPTDRHRVDPVDPAGLEDLGDLAGPEDQGCLVRLWLINNRVLLHHSRRLPLARMEHLLVLTLGVSHRVGQLPKAKKTRLACSLEKIRPAWLRMGYEGPWARERFLVNLVHHQDELDLDSSNTDSNPASRAWRARYPRSLSCSHQRPRSCSHTPSLLEKSGRLLTCAIFQISQALKNRRQNHQWRRKPR